MSYTVTLYQDINMPYVINDISAHNENDAIYKAKKFVATNRYFPCMSTEQVMNILVVKKVIKNKWNRNFKTGMEE